MTDDEAKDALTALADPIVWESRPYMNSKGHWLGAWNDKTFYRLDVPLEPGEVDATEFSRTWRITVSLDGNTLSSHGPSLRESKALCARHALTGDDREMQAIQDAGYAQARRYLDLETAAREPLLTLCGKHVIPVLDWKPFDTKAVLLFSAHTPVGTYSVRFVEGRRWVMQFQPLLTCAKPKAEEKCFLTREIVMMACGVHAKTGRWMGVLPDDAQI